MVYIYITRTVFSQNSFHLASYISDNMFFQHLSFIPRFDLPVGMYLLIVLPLCLGPIIALLFFDISSWRAARSEPKGCRKLGLRVTSNLADEFDEKYAKGGPPGKDKNGNDLWRIKSLWIYPVKSCAGIELNRGNVVRTGMEHDRQFTFAQLEPVPGNKQGSEKAGPMWKFITGRIHRLLLTLKTEVWVPDPASVTYSPDHAEVRSGGVLIVRYPCQKGGWRGLWAKLCRWFRVGVLEESFRVPLHPTADQIKDNGYTTEEMTIWKDSPLARNMGVHVPPDLKDYLGIRNPLSLFRVHHKHEREVYRCAPRMEQAGYQPVIGFPDAYPLHILNLASVKELSTNMLEDAPKLSALRFRPNFIITGPDAYAEDGWKRIRIGGYEYFVACRTARCKLPNVDPISGERHPSEPDRTLRKFRNVDAGGPQYGFFGMQMVPASVEGSIRVGDAIEVLETGNHRYIPQG